MPFKRSANNVSTDELIQLVTIMKAEGEFPDAEGKGSEHPQAARKELNTAVECLKQFSGEAIYAKLAETISKLSGKDETPMDWLVRMRVQTLACEKGDSAKLQILAWIEGIIRACATSHVQVQERLDIRKPSGSVGNSVGNGSPYADAMNLRRSKASRTDTGLV